MKEQLIDLLKTSTLLQAILTLVLLGVISYMFLKGMPVPELLTNSFLLIMGYYFGSKSQQAIERTLSNVSRKEE
jgi:hypothetical protein